MHDMNNIQFLQLFVERDGSLLCLQVLRWPPPEPEPEYFKCGS